MKGLPTELLYLLIFAGVLLFNFFTQQAARRRRAEARQEEEEQDALQEELPPEERIADFWGQSQQTQEALLAPVRAAEPIDRTEVPIVSPVRRRKRFSKASLLGTRQDIRNAIVIATILGPCRALEPPGTTPGSVSSGTSSGRSVQ